MYGFKTLFKYPTIFSFVTATCFGGGGWGDGGGGEGYFLFLLAALLSRYPMTLLFPTSWSLQCKLHFKFTASSNVLSRPPCGDTPTHTWPQELCKVIIHNPFLVFLTLNPGPNRQTWQILLFAENETRPLHSNIFSPAFFFWCFSSLHKLGCPEIHSGSPKTQSSCPGTHSQLSLNS